MPIENSSIKDSHIHLSFLSDVQLHNYFREAEKLSVKAWALGGYDFDDWLKQIEIKKINSEVKICFGLHPWMIEEKSIAGLEHELEEQWSELEALVYQAEAIGETGFDRFRLKDKTKKQSDEVLSLQDKYFECSLSLACELSKPVVLHVVQAHEIALKKIDLYPESYGIAHSFSGSVEVAREYVKRNFLISVGPRILGEGFTHLKEAVKQLDLTQLLIESDAPYDKNNPFVDPLELHKVAQKVAELKACAKEVVVKQTAENFDNIFNR